MSLKLPFTSIPFNFSFTRSAFMYNCSTFQKGRHFISSNVHYAYEIITTQLSGLGFLFHSL